MKKSKAIEIALKRLTDNPNGKFVKYTPNNIKRINPALKPGEYINILESVFNENGNIKTAVKGPIIKKVEINKLHGTLNRYFKDRFKNPDKVKKELFKIFKSQSEKIKIQNQLFYFTILRLLLIDMRSRHITGPAREELKKEHEHASIFEKDFAKELDNVQPGLCKSFDRFLEINDIITTNKFSKSGFCAAISILWLILKKKESNFKMNKKTFCALAKEAYDLNNLISPSMWYPSKFKPQDKELYKAVWFGRDYSRCESNLKGIIEQVR